MQKVIEEYLGDGLYAKYDGFHIVLMANSHISPTDTVYLDPHVFASLQRFVDRIAVAENEKLDKLPCGHSKSACWDANREVCVACEVEKSS